MLNENTIEIKYSDNFTIELEDAKKDYAEYDAIVKIKRIKKLIIGGRFTSITNERGHTFKKKTLKEQIQ